MSPVPLHRFPMDDMATAQAAQKAHYQSFDPVTHYGISQSTRLGQPGRKTKPQPLMSKYNPNQSLFDNLTEDHIRKLGKLLDFPNCEGGALDASHQLTNNTELYLHQKRTKGRRYSVESAVPPRLDLNKGLPCIPDNEFPSAPLPVYHRQDGSKVLVSELPSEMPSPRNFPLPPCELDGVSPTETENEIHRPGTAFSGCRAVKADDGITSPKPRKRVNYDRIPNVTDWRNSPYVAERREAQRLQKGLDKAAARKAPPPLTIEQMQAKSAWDDDSPTRKCCILM